MGLDSISETFVDNFGTSNHSLAHPRSARGSQEVTLGAMVPFRGPADFGSPGTFVQKPKAQLKKSAAFGGQLLVPFCGFKCRCFLDFTIKDTD